MSEEMHTNMTKEQIFAQLLDFQRNCDACKIAHHAARVPLVKCKECELGFWIRNFKKYLGIEENVNY